LEKSEIRNPKSEIRKKSQVPNPKSEGEITFGFRASDLRAAVYHPTMHYRVLGSTKLRVSVIGIGTWQFGGEWGKDFGQDEVDRMFARGRELGLNLIDTAECYGDHLSESLIGKAIEGSRGDWIIATKFGHKFHGCFKRTEPRTPADVERQVDESLIALRTDYVDLLQYHSWGDEDFSRRDVRDVLAKLIQSGKVRHVGNSIGNNDNLKQVEDSTGAHVEAIQVIYNRLQREPEQRVFAACQRQNLGVLARVPLASGYLSGKYKPGAAFSGQDHRANQKADVRDGRLEEAQRIIREEIPIGVNPAQWALAWCLKQPAVTCVIPGCKSVEQVESNAAAAELVN
jgi:myo-inositol catabolism protein IolS